MKFDIEVLEKNASKKGASETSKKSATSKISERLSLITMREYYKNLVVLTI